MAKSFIVVKEILCEIIYLTNNFRLNSKAHTAF